jgi:DNA polymerase-4/DNA polymerase V
MNAAADNPQALEYPRAILHVDGDSFFVSCELTRLPHLKGRPVVTGVERGIATAMSREAKALGIHRGMRIRDIRRQYPETIILPSDYRLYAMYARRMYSIVRKYARTVEEYSIDECFADLTGLAGRADGPAHMRGMRYEDIALAIQADLHESLGITFSMGLGVNKVTAKIASKWDKPAGSTFMPKGSIKSYLADLPIGKVWGIGRSTTMQMGKLGISTALDLAMKDRAWVAHHCDRPVAEIYEELQGNFVKELCEGSVPISVQRTRTFHPPSRDAAYVWSQISYHAEEACMRLRSQGLVAVRASLFLKSQEFQYFRGEAELPDPSAAPEDVLRALRPAFQKVWNERRHSGLMYRAAGVSLSGLRAEDAGSATLFEPAGKVGVSGMVHKAVDHIVHRFGHRAIYLGSSFRAMKGEGDFVPDERPNFDIIYLGEVG